MVLDLAAPSLLDFRENKMQQYRVYLIGPDGHIIQRTDLVCEDEEAATEQAKRLVDGHDVELWKGAQKIATFPHTNIRPVTLPRGE
jgi:hypothetical protein